MSDFRYRDALWEKLFLEALRNTSFEGVTVSISSGSIAEAERPRNAVDFPGDRALLRQREESVHSAEAVSK